MKKWLIGFVVLGLTLVGNAFGGTSSSAAESTHIVDINAGDMLLDDGTVIVVSEDGFTETKIDAAAIAGYDGRSQYTNYGITRKGELFKWTNKDKPKLVPGQTGIAQISGQYYVKKDGTLWSIDSGQVSGISGAVMVAGRGDHFAALLQNGDVIYDKAANVFGHFDDSASVTKIVTNGDEKVAVLENSGKLTAYYDFVVKIDTKIIAEDAIDVDFTYGGQLFVAHRDGTVGVKTDWIYDLEPIAGIANAVKVIGVDDVTLYYQQTGGSWKYRNARTTTSINVPSLSGLTFTASTLTPIVGEAISVEIGESYSTGVTRKVPLGQASIVIEKPYLLKAMSDGTLKPLAVGQTKVTVKSGGQSKTLTFSISGNGHLTGAKQINGVTYLPIKSVFQALGGTVGYSAATKSFDIRVGQTSMTLTTGSANAKLNGKAVALNGAVRTADGNTVFPASFLTKALGATLKWDAAYQQMGIALGSAKMTVETAETANIIKKIKIGDLARYIGKTYWINYFQGWERFAKLTVVDIVPDEQRSYTVVFKKTNGTLSESYSMGYDNVVALLKDGESFYTYDPMKKYKWSASVWAQVKAGKISTGMTKDMVRMSWGDPSSTSQASGGGITVETWGYSDFNYVTFTNGKVSGIYSY